MESVTMTGLKAPKWEKRQRVNFCLTKIDYTLANSNVFVSILIMSQLTEEIKQTKPFTSYGEEVWVNLSRTAAIAGHAVEQRLRPYGLSPTQYNVLRILRGAGVDGLVQHEVGSRLVAQVPDVPRILSRLENAGLIRRVRGTEDRRVVVATLTNAGMSLVNRLDEPMKQVHLGLFPGMQEKEMERLCELLELARGGKTSRLEE